MKSTDLKMMDLRENLKPIGAYVKDRERMLDEMFRCIKGKKLQAMFPDILKVFFFFKFIFQYHMSALIMQKIFIINKILLFLNSMHIYKKNV
jgi:hypothetical protein